MVSLMIPTFARLAWNVSLTAFLNLPDLFLNHQPFFYLSFGASKFNEVYFTRVLYVFLYFSAIIAISTAERKKNVSRRRDEERRISVRGWRTTYLGASMKNGASRREHEERRISARWWRTAYLDARMKNGVSRCEYEERHISPYTGRVLAVRAPTRYVVLHPSAEIRSSSAHPSICSCIWRLVFINLTIINDTFWHFVECLCTDINIITNDDNIVFVWSKCNKIIVIDTMPAYEFDINRFVVWCN